MLNQKELHRLRREELLQVLLEIQGENESLTQENRRLQEALASRTLQVEKAGSLAEAALQVTEVVARAQEAADLYLENTRRLCEQRQAQSQEALESTRRRCARLLRRTRELCLETGWEPEVLLPGLPDRIAAMFEEEWASSEEQP